MAIARSNRKRFYSSHFTLTVNLSFVLDHRTEPLDVHCIVTVSASRRDRQTKAEIRGWMMKIETSSEPYFAIYPGIPLGFQMAR